MFHSNFYLFSTDGSNVENMPMQIGNIIAGTTKRLAVTQLGMRSTFCLNSSP
jgi:hypothetical protein